MSAPFPIWLARVYDPPDQEGARLLIDRLWPRGVAKADLPLDGWLKDVTPEAALRKWFHADRSRWPEFRERYLAQLRASPEAVAACLDWCRRGPVILLTAEHDPGNGHAGVLRDFLAGQLARGSA